MSHLINAASPHTTENFAAETKVGCRFHLGPCFNGVIKDVGMLGNLSPLSRMPVVRCCRRKRKNSRITARFNGQYVNIGQYLTLPFL